MDRERAKKRAEKKGAGKKKKGDGNAGQALTKKKEE